MGISSIDKIGVVTQPFLAGKGDFNGSAGIEMCHAMPWATADKYVATTQAQWYCTWWLRLTARTLSFFLLKKILCYTKLTPSIRSGEYLSYIPHGVGAFGLR
jgi:hypothetical protein